MVCVLAGYTTSPALVKVVVWEKNTLHQNWNDVALQRLNVEEAAEINLLKMSTSGRPD